MRRRITFTLTLLTFVLAIPVMAAHPGAAISRARQALTARQFDQAVRLLQGAIPDASTLSEPERTQAVAAIHFYTALAFHGMSDAEKTREQLEHFFQFSPQTNRIDPSKYESQFVEEFNAVYNSLKKEESSNFDSVYPGWRTFSDDEPRPRPLETWGEGPELTILGTAEERNRWRRLNNDDDRHSFIEAFWKGHDTSPETEENEWRREFTKRVAFADQAFATEGPRGSITDRGRVFVLLGPPRVIRQKPLSEREGGANRVGGTVVPVREGPRVGFQAMEMSNRNMTVRSTAPLLKGKVERWIYARNQLPRTIPDAEVVFKFITQEGYGDNVLQREFFVNKILHDAAVRP